MRKNKQIGIRIHTAIEWLEKSGWTELIDPKWTLEIKRELENSGLELTEDEIRSALDAVIFPEPDYRPDNNQSIGDIIKNENI